MANTILSTNTIIFQSDVDLYTWPVTIQGGTQANPIIIKFGENLNFGTNLLSYFIINSEYITIDGQNFTFTFEYIIKFTPMDKTGSYSGLILNGTGISGVTNNDSFDNILIKNIGYIFNDKNQVNFTTTVGLYNGQFQQGGYICQPYYANGQNNCVIENCYTNGYLLWGDGGILGGYSSGTAKNCYSTNSIGLIIPKSVEDDYPFLTSISSGGIFGTKSLNGIAINCFSMGLINVGCGGIFGSHGISPIATNCYSLGDISEVGGGIMGKQTTISCTVSNCYSLGNISLVGGGIVVAPPPGTDPLLYVVKNCYCNNIYNMNVCPIVTSIAIGGITQSNTYCNDGYWNNIDANNALLGTDGDIWTDVNLTNNMSYLLTSFNKQNYKTNKKIIKSNKCRQSESGIFINYNYSIISINGKSPNDFDKIKIDPLTGVLSFCKIKYCKKTCNTYCIKIISYKLRGNNYFDYNIHDYKLKVIKY